MISQKPPGLERRSLSLNCPLNFWRRWRALPVAIYSSVIVSPCRPPPHQDWGRAGAAGNRFARDDKEPGAPAGGATKIPGERPRELGRDTRALSPAGMFGRKAPLRLAAQKSRSHAPLAPMCSATVSFLKWGVRIRLDKTSFGDRIKRAVRAAYEPPSEKKCQWLMVLLRYRARL